MNVQYNTLPNKFARKRNLKRKNPYSATSMVAVKRQQLTPTQQSQARRIAKQVVSANTDYRITDIALSSTVTDWAGSVYNVLANLTRGDNDKDNFEGNTIFPKYWELRWMVKAPTPGGTAHIVRVILGQLIEGATVPSITDVLEVTGTSYAVISAKNNVFAQTFNILYDQLIALQNTNSVAEVAQKVFIPEWKLNKIKFAAASTNVVSGGLFVYVISDDATAATYKSSFEMYSRVMFST